MGEAAALKVIGVKKHLESPIHGGYEGTLILMHLSLQYFREIFHARVT
ncbi:8373_t:CDS:2 [Entrophospora sp. SA101]|nr:12911_t:CDS:2 [Entrophospora sp. SA101]CAJ0751473.1 8373_t:CDS:2 [Entrophospora sp. SA101]CAJ0836149.1 678_t:CDS:2 [Entrophospora sp. SA101]CAJ0836666.1 17773_t:CDS:2 [Entrophospora sp. SA101]CAJ0887865.1 5276_t:CDS:2 [Entrophospora sp. SA101]